MWWGERDWLAAAEFLQIAISFGVLEMIVQYGKITSSSLVKNAWST